VFTLGLISVFTLAGFAPASRLAQTPTPPPDAPMQTSWIITINENDTFDIVQRAAIAEDAALLLGFDDADFDEMIEWLSEDFQWFFSQGETTVAPVLEPGFMGYVITGAGIVFDELEWFVSEFWIERIGDEIVVVGEFNLDPDFYGEDIDPEELALSEQSWMLISITFPDGITEADGNLTGDTVYWLPQMGEVTAINARGAAGEGGPPPPIPTPDNDEDDPADDPNQEPFTPAPLPPGHSLAMVWHITVHENGTLDLVETTAFSDEFAVSQGFADAGALWDEIGWDDFADEPESLFTADGYRGFVSGVSGIELAQLERMLGSLALSEADGLVTFTGELDMAWENLEDFPPLQAAIFAREWVGVIVTFPGEVIEHNGTLTDTTVSWQQQSGGISEFHAVARIADGGSAPGDASAATDDSNEGLPILAWVGIGAGAGIIIVGAATFFILRAHRTKS